MLNPVNSLMRFVVNALLTAVLFCFVYPQFASGVQFHGQFWPEGVLYAGVFSLLATAIILVLRALIKAFALYTLGIGMLIVGPLLLFGFWLIPAIQLQVFALYFPAHFTVASWGSAIWAGFLLMVVNILTLMLTNSNRSSSTSQV